MILEQNYEPCPWFKWFAWHPVVLDDTRQKVWMEEVWRQDGGGYGEVTTSYRRTKPEPEVHYQPQKPRKNYKKKKTKNK